MKEQKFQFYVERLESRGITVEEKPLQDFPDQEIRTSLFWNDFSMEIEIQQVDHVYYDRGKRILYFLRSTPKNGIKVEALVTSGK